MLLNKLGVAIQVEAQFMNYWLSKHLTHSFSSYISCSNFKLFMKNFQLIIKFL